MVPVTSISVASVAEPGNEKVEAGSESAGALAETALAGGLWELTQENKEIDDL
jgi:hypothetical protein